MGIFSAGKERGTQLRFRDDRKFEFRKLDIEDTFLVEKKEGAITRGWKHFYKTLYAFPGYKNIPADVVTICFDRDIILDPYNIVDKADMPDNYKPKERDAYESGRSNIVSWLIDVGHARRFKIMAKKGRGATTDKIVWFLGCALILELLTMGIRYAFTRGG